MGIPRDFFANLSKEQRRGKIFLLEKERIIISFSF
jgi:hypothetical protein